MLKETVLHNNHVELGAKMVDFAGWHMPVQYSSIIEEHKNVRQNVGLFDVSHMGEIFISGKDSIKFLQKIVPQNIENLFDSKAVYCQLTNENGGIIDDLIIYKLKDEKYLAIVNASRVDTDINWFIRNSLDFDVYIDNQSHNYSLIALQGPKSDDVLKNLGYETEQDFFTIREVLIKNIPVMLSKTGYTGENGYEILLKNKFAKEMWNLLLQAGKDFSILPIGLGARDTLRLEAALPLYGNDLSEETTPIEAGLSWTVPKDKTAAYNGKDVILNQISSGTQKKVIGIKMITRVVPRHEQEVYFNNEKVGEVTSGSFAPSINCSIALCNILNKPEISVGSTVQVLIRDKFYDAVVVKRPFINKRNSNKENKE
ncbi:glycine cleavage system aminomethyltransferase GcvT [bacterium]|nr:glycine cleavage system aminomethyltransferase GcvT [bacterium]